MAHSAHSDPEMMVEHQDTPVVLEKKIKRFAEVVKKSKHFVIFTGAGISTDAGIPDFRGPDGAWTLKAQGKTRKGPTVSTLKAIPTYTHMAIRVLQEKGYCKYLISQNCDGLHRRSGISADKISELHGNGNIEYCEDCGFEYLRDFRCLRIHRRGATQNDRHYTGRHCVISNDGKVCNGRLLNSTIDFGQNLPEVPLDKADYHSRKSDLHLVLGSSLTVSPACDFPYQTSKNAGGKLVICNLQLTPLEKCSSMTVHSRCDKFMRGVMECLGLDVPVWRLRRQIALTIDRAGTSLALSIGGIATGTKGQIIPASILKKVETEAKKGMKKEGFTTDDGAKLFWENAEGLEVYCRVHFMGHYKEPPLDLQIPNTGKSQITHLAVSLDPHSETRDWSIDEALCWDGGEKGEGKKIDFFLGHNHPKNQPNVRNQPSVQDQIVRKVPIPNKPGQYKKVSTDEEKKIMREHVASCSDHGCFALWNGPWGSFIGGGNGRKYFDLTGCSVGSAMNRGVGWDEQNPSC